MGRERAKDGTLGLLTFWPNPREALPRREGNGLRALPVALCIQALFDLVI